MPQQGAEHTEKMITSEEIYKGKIIRVTRDKVALENGHTTYREVVHHNGGAAIIAINEREEVALVRQYRYALGRELIELPAGKVEAGEDPAVTAVRELEEEVGCRADKWIPFGDILPTVGYCTEVIYLFIATELTATKQKLDADEFLSVFWIPLDEAVAMIYTGEIRDAKAVSGLLRAVQYLRK